MISFSRPLSTLDPSGVAVFQDHAPAQEIAMLDHAGFPVAD
jgi:hypothetical protein